VEFALDKSRKDNIHPYCKSCIRAYQHSIAGLIGNMLKGAKHRAAKRKVAFSITREDIAELIKTKLCPICNVILDYSLSKGRVTSASPSLDSVIPSEGYTKDNTALICNRCNGKKGNMTVAELRHIADWIEKKRNGSIAGAVADS